eukprot:TRINITY_DN6223_c0_g1_i1.p1 TRINITY_DN6223_c0_g1~~TRINITY_DN6223_c0_g1_i1.p1  ORF type:complete len:336 (+),score=85.43 TRINITY_DN6223_c0_g1_i1:95-1102(+)
MLRSLVGSEMCIRDRYLLGQVVTIVLMLASIADSVAYRWRASITAKLMSPLYLKIEELQDLNDRLLMRVRKLESRMRSLHQQKLPQGYDDDKSPVTAEEDKVPRSSLLGAMQPEELSEISFMGDGSVMTDVGPRAPSRHWSDPYIFAACSGAIGALSVLFAGCVSKLLVTTLSGDNQLENSISYVFIFGMVLCVLAQTHLLNRAMIEGDAMSVLPVFVAFWTSLSVISGIIFYQQDTKGSSWVATGLCCMCAGVILLVQHERLHRAYKADMEMDHSPYLRHLSMQRSLNDPTQHTPSGTTFELGQLSPILGHSSVHPPNDYGSVVQFQESQCVNS